MWGRIGNSQQPRCYGDTQAQGRGTHTPNSQEAGVDAPRLQGRAGLVLWVGGGGPQTAVQSPGGLRQRAFG